jgi:hypothetical protein
MLARITYPSHVVAHGFAAKGFGKYLRELPFGTICADRDGCPKWLQLRRW